MREAGRLRPAADPRLRCRGGGTPAPPRGPVTPPRWRTAVSSHPWSPRVRVEAQPLAPRRWPPRAGAVGQAEGGLAAERAGERGLGGALGEGDRGDEFVGGDIEATAGTDNPKLVDIRKDHKIIWLENGAPAGVLVCST